MANPSEPDKASKFFYETANSMSAHGAARLYRLNKLYGYYRCEQYDHCKTNWDGTQFQPDEHNDAISRGSLQQPGFIIEGEGVPLRNRRPSAPYQLGRLIVNRFTSLLFSERRHPKPRVPGDKDTEDYLNAVCNAGRLWAKMIVARNYGGAMGSVAVGFKLVKGKPIFEVFDPRWCTPNFSDRHNFDLKSIEIRYIYTDTVMTKDGPEEVQYWYRRLIDTQADEIWDRVRVKGNEEPRWDSYTSAGQSKRVEHHLQLCPVVWIQNQEVQEAIDGDPDCLGCFDMIHQVDQLFAQGAKGVISNSDPTLVISSDAEMREIRKGSDNAIKLPKGDNAEYLELQGSGPRAATELAEKFEAMVCRMARVVLDTSGSMVAKTANEVDKDYSSMMEQADILREQYGEHGVKKLLDLVLTVCRKATAPFKGEDGLLVNPKIYLPMKAIVDPISGTTSYAEHKLGPSSNVQLVWGAYFQPTLTDMTSAVNAATMALEKKVVDQKTAVKAVASYFDIDDVDLVIHEIKKKEEEDMKKAQELAQQQMQMEQQAGMGAEKEPVEEPADEEEEMSDEDLDKLLAEEDDAALEEEEAPEVAA